MTTIIKERCTIVVMVNARRALLGLLLVLAACGRSNGLEPLGDADCCPISDSPMPGDCVNFGGSETLNGGTCSAVCDGADTYVRTTDAMGCPKLVLAACADAGADAASCR
jgi:hypothetical protein